MRILIYASTALGFLAGTLGAQAVTQSAADIATVSAMDSVWGRNYARNDTAMAMKLMADDFFMTSMNGATKDRATELADIRAQPGFTTSYFRTTGVRVRVYSGAAVVAAFAEWAFGQGNNMNAVRRRYTATYVKGGPLGWQLVALHMGRAE